MAVEEMQVPVDGAAIVDALAVLDLWEARVVSALSGFDGARLWELEGATSAFAWLRHQGGRSRRQAGRLRALAAGTAGLPVTVGAWVSGELSSGQVDVIVAHVDAATIGVFVDHEAAVVPALVGLSVADTETAMGAWRARATADGVEPDEEPVRSLHCSRVGDGRVVLDGELDGLGGATVTTALRVATTADVEGEPVRTAAQRRADALVDVCRFFLDHQRGHRGGRHRPHVNVVIELDALHRGGPGRLVDGGRVDRAAMGQLVCDATLHRVVVAGRSAVLDYGTATRTVPAPLWNALVVRDEHCRFPGCDRSSHWCEAHHVVPVSEGGATRLDRLVLSCSRHHHLVHRAGWTASLAPDATYQVTDPTGVVRTSRPPAAIRTHPPWAA